jgi:cyclophilin family peptidyl-prolyl cis-trans isomerase
MLAKIKFLITILFLVLFYTNFNFSALAETKIQKSDRKQTTSNLVIQKGNLEVTLVTSMGKIRFELFKEKNPSTVENFLSYVKMGYYNNTIFHRIIDGFVIQGGAYDVNFNLKYHNKEAIKNTSFLGLKNTIGTVAMARKPHDPHSATSQFFINLSNNSSLDFSKEQQGYAVFGRVSFGMDVVQKIAKIKIGQREGMYNIPFYPAEALIKSVYLNKDK